MAEELRTLRASIAEVDRGILELLHRRMELSARVGRVKAASGMEVVARDVEDRVLGRARERAEAAGISDEAMESIFRDILRASVERQHRVGMEERVRRGGRVLVIGGAGGLGSWLRRFLALVGHRVDAVDPAWVGLPVEEGRWTALEEVPSLEPYDAMVLSVPLDRAPEVLDAVTARRPRGLVVEIASIQSHLDPALARAEDAGVRTCALHPMFGPRTSPYEPLTFVLACRREPTEERSAVDAFLRHPYTRVVAIPFAHHDRLMGWLLGLAHLHGMLFGAALAESGLDPEELLACASTTFTRQAATARSVLLEDPELYFDIQRLNPHREAVYAAARSALDRLVSRVRGEDLEGFRSLLAGARRAVGGTE
jgi:chorismate mutase / prephenate dehydrogenase